MCWIPQSKYVTDSLNLPPCLTASSTRCMANHFFFEVISHLDDPEATGCPYPCEEHLYTVYPRRDPKVVPAGSGVAAVFLFYRSNVYSVMEEYLLYDANAVIAALGGSLGLFLGFSFLQVGRAAINYFVRGK